MKKYWVCWESRLRRREGSTHRPFPPPPLAGHRRTARPGERRLQVARTRDRQGGVWSWDSDKQVATLFRVYPEMALGRYTVEEVEVEVEVDDDAE